MHVEPEALYYELTRNFTSRYLNRSRAVRASVDITIPTDIIWIQVDRDQSAVATQLTRVWDQGGLDTIINLVDTCSIQLELAAAWNLSIFTSVSLFADFGNTYHSFVSRFC